MRRIVAVLSFALALSACSHRGGPAPTPTRSNSSLITREEIEKSKAGTAYEAIQRLRGRYLASRGQNSIYLNPQTYPTVFLDSQEYGPISALRNVAANDLEEIRFFPGAEATTKFGAQYGGGVIQLITRVQ